MNKRHVLWMCGLITVVLVVSNWDPSLSNDRPELRGAPSVTGHPWATSEDAITYGDCDPGATAQQAPFTATALSGKVIYCTGGHGMIRSRRQEGWGYQRPPCFRLIEDLGNQDQLTIFAEICAKLGATVVPMRPVGNQPLGIIVHCTEPQNVIRCGTWREVNSRCAGPTGRRTHLTASAETTVTARVQFIPTIPSTGFYPVYVWLPRGEGRTRQVYRIVWNTGESYRSVDCDMVSEGWVYLGTFHFRAGRSAYVELTNLASSTTTDTAPRYVIADTVRFGNAMNLAANLGVPPESLASIYWLQESLPSCAPAAVVELHDSDWDNNIGCGPRAAAFFNNEMHGAFTDRLYLSFHTNASAAGLMRGLQAVVNETDDMQPKLQLQVSAKLLLRIEEELSYPGSLWQRSEIPFTVGHSFGEVNRRYLNEEMTAALLEVGYHDNPLDASLLLNPEIRVRVARSSARALCEWFGNARSNSFFPNAPAGLQAQTSGTHTIAIRWQPALQTVVQPLTYNIYSYAPGYHLKKLVTTSDNAGVIPAADHTQYIYVTCETPEGESESSQLLRLEPGGVVSNTSDYGGYVSVPEVISYEESTTIVTRVRSAIETLSNSGKEHLKWTHISE